jgi:hypothetical protein
MTDTACAPRALHTDCQATAGGDRRSQRRIGARGCAVHQGKTPAFVVVGVEADLLLGRG